MIEPAKRAFLVEHLGEERTKAIEDATLTLQQEMKSMGVGFKQISALFEEEPPAKEPLALAAKELGIRQMDIAQVLGVSQQRAAQLFHEKRGQERVIEAVYAAAKERGIHRGAVDAVLRAHGVMTGATSYANPAAPYISDLAQLAPGAKAYSLAEAEDEDRERYDDQDLQNFAAVAKTIVFDTGLSDGERTKLLAAASQELSSKLLSRGTKEQRPQPGEAFDRHPNPAAKYLGDLARHGAVNGNQ